MSRIVHGGLSDADLAAARAGAEGVIDLSANLHPDGPHPAVIEAARNAAIDRYPEPGAASLRDAIAESIAFEPEQVLVTAGATGAIHLAARALLHPGDACTVFTPAFSEYESAARAAGAHVVRHAAAPPEFVPPSDSPPVPLAMLGNPGNPHGAYLEAGAVRRLAAESGGVLLLDVVYEPFVEGAWGANELVRQGFPVLAVHSFTKLHSIPGLRVGYVTGSTELIARLAALQQPWVVGAPALAAARAALPLDASRRAITHEVGETREAMRSFFGVRGIATAPSRANFVLARVGDAGTLRARLLRRGFALRECGSFGLPEWVRIATPSARDLPRLLAAIDETLEERT